MKRLFRNTPIIEFAILFALSLALQEKFILGIGFAYIIFNLTLALFPIYWGMFKLAKSKLVGASIMKVKDIDRPFFVEGVWFQYVSLSDHNDSVLDLDYDLKIKMYKKRNAEKISYKQAYYMYKVLLKKEKRKRLQNKKIMFS